MQNLTLPDSKFFEAESTLESPVDDWSDTTQEMLDTLPQTWSRSILYCIVAFGAIALPWAMLAKVDEVGVARGRLEPRGKTLRLDAVTSGTVAAVKVKTGQQVKKGDRIIELNADLIKSELQQTQAKLDGLVNRYAQLTGLRSHLEVAIRTQQQQRQSQELEQVAQISQTRQRIGFYRNSATLSQAVLTKDQGKAARYRTFREQGIVAGVQVEDAERAEIESQQRVEQARSEIAQTLAELQKQQSTYQKILRQSDLAILDSAKQIKELETQMSDLKSEIKQTQNQLRSLQFQWKQRVISVPVEGTIFQLPIQNAGAVVQTGQNVAQIAPKGAPLVLRAQMSSDQSGFLRVGLPVKVKFDAYPFQDYGIVQGYIRWISPDSRKVEPSPQTQQEVFDVEIQLEKNQIQAGGKAVPLTAGQTATAEVIIRQRHLIDFMLDPFRKLQNSGMNM
jgi:hemolysin D